MDPRQIVQDSLAIEPLHFINGNGLWTSRGHREYRPKTGI
jgi:hypothetical protein